MKKTFKFTFDTETEQDIIQILESIPKLLRSQYIVEVIRFAKAKLIECSLNSNLNNTTTDTVNQTEIDKASQEKKETKKKLDISKLFGGF